MVRNSVGGNKVMQLFVVWRVSRWVCMSVHKSVTLVLIGTKYFIFCAITFKLHMQVVYDDEECYRGFLFQVKAKGLVCILWVYRVLRHSF